MLKTTVVPQDRPLGNTTHHQSLPGHGAIDHNPHNPLAVSIQLTLYPLNSPAFKSISGWIAEMEDVLQDSVKGRTVLAAGLGFVQDKWVCHDVHLQFST